MKKIIFSAVAASAILNAADITATVFDSNDKYLNWALPGTQDVGEKFLTLTNASFWSALGNDEGARISGLFTDLVAKNEAAKTAIAALGGAAGNYQTIEDSKQTRDTNQAAYNTFMTNSGLENLTSTNFEELATKKIGELSETKDQKESAKTTAEQIVGAAKDGETPATGLHLAKLINSDASIASGDILEAQLSATEIENIQHSANFVSEKAFYL